MLQGDVSTATFGTVDRTFTYSYNAASELTQVSDPSATIAYTLDSLGRATSIVNTINGLTPTVTFDHIAGNFADGMGSRPMAETSTTKNKSLPTVKDILAGGMVHTENGGLVGGAYELKDKPWAWQVPWTSYYSGYALMGPKFTPSKNTGLSDGGTITAPDGTSHILEKGYQTIPSGITK